MFGHENKFHQIIRLQVNLRAIAPPKKSFPQGTLTNKSSVITFIHNSSSIIELNGTNKDSDWLFFHMNEID